MFSLSHIKEGVKSKRVGSYDKTGGNKDYLMGIKDGVKISVTIDPGAGILYKVVQ